MIFTKSRIFPKIALGLILIAILIASASTLHAQESDKSDMIDEDVAEEVKKNIEEANKADPTNMLGNMAPRPYGMLRFLDRLHGEVSELAMEIGEEAMRGHLQVTLIECMVPEEAPGTDALAYLEIDDTRQPGPDFKGWMMASSPAVSAMDHPRYDIWVVSCSEIKQQERYIVDPNSPPIRPPERPRDLLMDDFAGSQSEGSEELEGGKEDGVDGAGEGGNGEPVEPETAPEENGGEGPDLEAEEDQIDSDLIDELVDGLVDEDASPADDIDPALIAPD